MNLSVYERYEIKAYAFHRMTGHMAPGKDPASASYPASFEERTAAWDKFMAEHGPVILAMLRAFEEIMPGDEE